MTNAPPVNTGTISVTSGSVTVMGSGTPFLTADVANGLLVTGGDVSVVLAVQSEIELTLYVPWTGPTLADVPYAIWRTYAQTAKMVQIHDRLNALIDQITAQHGDLPPYIRDQFLAATDATAARAALGIGNIDNTADVDKPVSTAVAQALSGKQNTLGFTPLQAGAPLPDETVFHDPVVESKRVRLDAGNVSVGQTRVISMPDRDIDLAGFLPSFAASAALPTSDIGPIWHADYASLMVWHTFNANGASYAGYASMYVGQPDADMVVRPGYLKRNGASHSKTTRAALWNWALHHGWVVSAASWTAGPFQFCDNGNGTFKVPDQRGEFERLADDGRGIDPGRVLGSVQADAARAYWQVVAYDAPWLGANTRGNVSQTTADLTIGRLNSGYGFSGPHRIQTTDWAGNTEPETRPRNVAKLACIKF